MAADRLIRLSSNGFLATNQGVLIDGDLSKKAGEMKTGILTTILQ